MRSIPGLCHLLCLRNRQQCCSTAALTSLSASADLAEVQDECAWRLGQWDEDGSMNQQPGAAGLKADLGERQSAHSFHGAVRRCLEALSSGQHDRWSTILSSARTVRALQITHAIAAAAVHQMLPALTPARPDTNAYIVQAIVQSLGMLSTESTASVSPALAKLQMLQMLNDAWSLRWPDSAQSDNSSENSQEYVRQPLVPDDAAIAQLEAACQRREAVTGQLLLRQLYH
jgi:hypothetical protein